jgi:hypothetical protein
MGGSVLLLLCLGLPRLASLGSRPQPFGLHVELIEHLSSEVDQIFDFGWIYIVGMGRVIPHEAHFMGLSFMGV